MSCSEFAIFAPDVQSKDPYLKALSHQCRVLRIRPDLFEVWVSGELLGMDKFDKTAWLVICEEAVHECAKGLLCFSDLIWDHAAPGDDLYEWLPMDLIMSLQKYTRPHIVLIARLTELDRQFQARESHEDGWFTFELSDLLIARTYLCLEFPGPVLDGGVHATFDLPALALAAGSSRGDG